MKKNSESNKSTQNAQSSAQKTQSGSTKSKAKGCGGKCTKNAKDCS